MDAHDGNVLWDASIGQYVWYAASYGLCKEDPGEIAFQVWGCAEILPRTSCAGPSGCASNSPGSCGFQLDHNVSVFTSSDLVSWVDYPSPAFQVASASLPGGAGAVLFCPKVLRNPTTGLYVMWFNWIKGSNFGDSYYAVATSSSPLGPFTVLVPQITTLAWPDTGDFGLFQVRVSARTCQV